MVKCMIGKAGGVVGATPEGSYGLSYFVKCKNDINGGINLF